MVSIKIVNELSDIKYDKWSSCADFKSKDRIVDQNGKKHQILDKRMREYSILEKAGRGFIGVAAVICSFGLALLSKDVRGLFKKIKTVRFAVPIEQLQNKKILEIFQHVHFTKNFVEKSGDDLKFQPLPLSECNCAVFPRLRSPRRNNLENAAIQQLCKNYPDKT
jgi:hypothetical protein